ncbi:MAG: sulfite exporter TauE/SafE family protein [Anaerolineales bacterium]|jgi:uncharacterized membrane protein YfcA
MNILEDFSLLIASFVAALFGQGGGILYTPLQVWSGVDFHSAAPISLFLILIISISSTLVFHKAHQVDWRTALVLEAPTTLGAFLGGILSQYVSSQTLGLLLFLLLVPAGWYMLHPPKETIHRQIITHPSRWIWRRKMNGVTYDLDLRLIVPVMLAVGLLTSMVGIGGGALKVPLMILLFGIPVPIAIGSSAFMVGLTAAAGLLGHISVGGVNWTAALLLAIPVFIGGQIGSRLSVHLKAQNLEKWFGVFILMIAFISAVHIEMPL